MSDNASTDTGAGLAEREVKPRQIIFAKSREGTENHGAADRECLVSSFKARVKSSLSTPLTRDDIIEPHGILEDVLDGIGLDLGASGASVAFSGKDPILKSPWPLATMGGVALMAKAVAAAHLWNYRTGEEQSLSLDLRKVPHRLCPFYDAKWELINGYAPGLPHDPANPFWPTHMHPTRDGRWIQLFNVYPKAKTHALAFLNCADNYQSIAAVTRKWDAFELEREANSRGLQATVVRSVEEFLETEQFAHLAPQPLIEIEKIGESDPIPFSPNPTAPLDGVRALGLGRVIAGAGLGRALSFHGADVVNIWRPGDFETDVAYHSAHVGMRSSTVEFAQPEGRARFNALLRSADVFFANRRPDYLRRHRLTAEELAEIRPGLVHVELSLFGPTGPWSGRTGFDQNAGGVSGIFAREGTLENPALTEIFVVNDYAMAWLSFLGVAIALRRRAEEGGSYRVRLSLARLSMWLLQLGTFDKAYAHQIAHSPGDHAFLDPDTFTAETPLGLYQGVTDLVQMSRTPGGYRTPLVPRGSSRPEWLEPA